MSLYQFNKVEGHALNFGLYADDLFDKRLYSSLEFKYGFSDKKFKTDFFAEYYLGKYRTYKLSLHAYRTITSLFSETDNYNVLTSTFLSLFTKYDFRDYYYRRGFRFDVSGNVFPILELGAAYINRKDESAQNNTNFSIINKSKKFRDNPPVYEANIRAVAATFSLDFRKYIEDGYFSIKEKICA